jgi:hypothetical protein
LSLEPKLSKSQSAKTVEMAYSLPPLVQRATKLSFSFFYSGFAFFLMALLLAYFVETVLR